MRMDGFCVTFVNGGTSAAEGLLADGSDIALRTKRIVCVRARARVCVCYVELGEPARPGEFMNN